MLNLIKYSVFVAFLLVVPTTLHSQDLFGFLKTSGQTVDFGDEISNSEMLTVITILENRRWVSDSLDLREISQKIPLNSKYTLYDKYKINSNLFFLNFYGIGSLFQGDYLTSGIVVAGLGVGLATNISVSNLVKDTTTRNIWVATGTTIAVGAIIYGLVRPFFYAEEQNSTLRKSLFSDQK